MTEELAAAEAVGGASTTGSWRSWPTMPRQRHGSWPMRARPVGGTVAPGTPGSWSPTWRRSCPAGATGSCCGEASELAAAMSLPASPAERESLAREAVAYARSAAFARAFLSGLGEDGVRDLLTVLGDGDLGPHQRAGPDAGRRPRRCGADRPGRDTVEDVLTATYVDPDDCSTYRTWSRSGMGIVLRAVGAAGPRQETVVAWGRQLLARERTQARRSPRHARSTAPLPSARPGPDGPGGDRAGRG